MPLWIKFSNLPDSYWTDDGLAHVASVIGEPLGADQLTAKLEILPFAKMQVNYTLGDPLPNDINVTVIDPVTEERSIAKVLVSYPVRPLFCTGCNSLGHSPSACPKIKRVWKQKDVSSAESPPGDAQNLYPYDTAAEVNNPNGDGPVEHSHATPIKSSNPDGDWTEVKRKKPQSPMESEYSPTPPVKFKNLKKIDEIEGKKAHPVPPGSPKCVTKSQKKKLKTSMGSSPQAQA